MLSRIISRPLGDGDKAPDITLPDQDGVDVRLADEYAAGPVVIYFFPKAFTPVCTAEACSFRDNNDVFTDAGATVFGVSHDSVEKLKSFHGKNRLNHRLLSDPDGVAHKAFGVRSGGDGAASFLLNDRITFVIDRDGVVRATVRVRLAADPHVDEALAMVKTLAQ